MNPMNITQGNPVLGQTGIGCLFTEAISVGLGAQDPNAEPVKVLQFFVEKVASGTPQGQQLIQAYDQMSPLVCEAIEARPDAMSIFKQIYDQFIAPSVEAIKGGNYPQALQIYQSLLQAVMPLAQQAMEMQDAAGSDEGGEGEMEQASEPPDAEATEMTGMDEQPMEQPMAQGGGVLSQFNADEEYPSSVRFGRG